jgi:hypothetical protein
MRTFAVSIGALLLSCAASLTGVGTTCAVADDCYPGVTRSDIRGEVMCQTRVKDGYCTHRCVTDSDCCAVSGECGGGVVGVCSPFESTGDLQCFISCESKDLNGVDETKFCSDFHASFVCRSTGGGSSNRKICAP